MHAAHPFDAVRKNDNGRSPVALTQPSRLLLRLGAFPEPFFGGDDTEAHRWSHEYAARVNSHKQAAQSSEYREFLKRRDDSTDTAKQPDDSRTRPHRAMVYVDGLKAVYRRPEPA
jgi:hypothetical protein